MEKQEYTFEVKFSGPLVENILAVKDNLTEEELDAVYENFFNKVYNDEFSALGFVSEDNFFTDYSIEAESPQVALRALQLELELLDGLTVENIKKLDV